MNDHQYLFRVLKLSIVPRAVTFFLTLVSFPLMLRSVGATAYGVIIYVGAVISVLESAVDFGVSSAAGKAIAEVRAHRPQLLRVELSQWTRLQGLVAIIGIVPLLLVSYLIVERSQAIAVSLSLLCVMVVSSWAAIASNFVRACLRSVLDFTGLMIVDTAESVVRSIGWLAVAWFFPTAMGVAGAGLLTVLITSGLGAVILVLAVRRDYPTIVSSGDASGPRPVSLSYRHMMGDSASFLGLRLSTRMFQAFPIVLIGRLYGAPTIGVLGAFAKVSELANLPFGVIGNALAVRAQEIVLRRTGAIAALWNAMLRFIVLSAAVAGTVYLGAKVLATFLAPDEPSAADLFSLLSITIVTSAVSSIIAPISDYVGALKQRILLLTALAFLQLPIIWVGSRVYGQKGAIIGYVLALCLMSVGYAAIAKAAYFGSNRYRPSPEVLRLLFLIVCALILASLTGQLTTVNYVSRLVRFDVGVLQTIVFVGIMAIGIMTTRVLRAAYVGHALFDFTGTHRAVDLSPNPTSSPR
jgi:O-antigen/teichoic acid export membrane protein